MESEEAYERDYEDGEYYILIKEFDSPWLAKWVWNRNAGRLTDFSLKIDARQIISGRGAYGVVFHLQDAENYYNFEVSSRDGGYSILKVLNGTWSYLQPRTESEYINKDNGTSHLKVVCQGSQIEVYINGHHLTTVTDSSFTEGYVGMFFLAVIDPNSRVAFDNMEIYSLD